VNTIAPHAHIVDGMALVITDGELDLARSARLRSVLRDAVDTAPERIVVDLSTVTLLDASVAGVLARQRARAEAAGIILTAVAAQGVVLEVLEILDLAKPLDAYAPRDTAPPRPRLPCCTPDSVHAEDLADDVTAAAGDRPSLAALDDAVWALLAEAAALTEEDRQRQRLRARAIELTLPAAYQLAGRYRGRGERDDDLLQVAALGLMKAVNGYDPQRGHLFSDYALPTILGELRRHFRDKGWYIRAPRRLQELLLDARKTRDHLTQELGRLPEIAEVANELDVPVEDVTSAFEAAEGYRLRSLSTPVDDASGQLGDVIGEVDRGYESVENHESIEWALRGLPVRMRRMVRLRFYADLTQDRIADELGISQMHVSRLLRQAYATMYDALVSADSDR
jgi:RNA polymerase sigma-B factor